MPTKRTRKLKQRKSKKVRKGGADDYEMNVRNCERYYHPFNKSFCTERDPESGAIRAQFINYPGFFNPNKSLTIREGRNKGQPLPKGIKA